MNDERIIGHFVHAAGSRQTRRRDVLFFYNELLWLQSIVQYKRWMLFVVVIVAFCSWVVILAVGVFNLHFSVLWRSSAHENAQTTQKSK